MNLYYTYVPRMRIEVEVLAFDKKNARTQIYMSKSPDRDPICVSSLSTDRDYVCTGLSWHTFDDDYFDIRYVYLISSSACSRWVESVRTYDFVAYMRQYLHSCFNRSRGNVSDM